MAKPNNNNKQRQNNDYFTKNIKQQGENFIGRKTATELQKDAIFIFRDIAKGNIDISKYGCYFEDDTFLTNCIIAANAKLIYSTISRDGVQALIEKNNMYGVADPVVYTVLQNHINTVTAYGIILANLTAIQNTNDINYLYVMANQLKQYRFNI